MVLNFQRRRRKRKKDNAETRGSGENASGVEERTVNGSIVVVNEAGGVRGGDIAGHRHAGSVLAGVFELARKILARIRGGVAAGAAADGAWILRARGHGAARAAGKTVDRTLRSWTGIHVRRTDSNLGAVQFSICSAAPDRFV